MKIGIVTWYKNGNYGGTLQAFALKKTLEIWGNDVEFINYSYNYSLKDKFIRIIKNIGMLIIFPKAHLSRKKIWSFVKANLKESKLINNYDELIKYSKKYNKVICGSDQIWSCAHGIDGFYFLDFVEKNKKISYAPSIGYNKIPKEYESKFIKYIKDFDVVSVREEEGKKIINDLCGMKVNVVIDPSLLLTRSQWIDFSKSSTINKKRKYILCYLLKNSPKYAEFIRYIENITNLEILYVSTERHKTAPFNKHIVAGIEDFVNLINNSEFIITDSFHGMAFSINLNKKFAIFKRFDDNDIKCQNSRIYNLLDITGLRNRIITSKESLLELYNSDIDFENVNDRLDKARNDSLKYLKKSIGGKNE